MIQDQHQPVGHLRGVGVGLAQEGDVIAFEDGRVVTLDGDVRSVFNLKYLFQKNLSQKSVGGDSNKKINNLLRSTISSFEATIKVAFVSLNRKL